MPETLSPDQVLDAVENWTLLQINDFVKKFEEKFDVSAAAPVAVAAGPAAGGAAAAAPVEEKTEFTVVIKAVPADKKIGIIKAVRTLKAELGLKEAKDLVEAAPKELLVDVNKDEAEKAKKTLTEAGAEVEVK